MSTHDHAHHDSVPTGVLTPDRTPTDVNDASLADSLEEFLGLLRAGRRPSREDFLARHGASAGGSLADCLSGLELIAAAAPQLLAATGSAMDADPLFAPFPPATHLGDYRIGREIGRGGMGVVYEAEQLSLGRQVALKVLPVAASLDPKQRQRFQLEAQAAAHLHHPNIVPVFAVGQDQGVHFYAMQFIPGRSLASIVKTLRKSPGWELPGPADQALARANDLLTHPIDESSAEQGGSSISAGDAATPPPSGGGSKSSVGSSTSQRGMAFCRTVARIGRQAALALEHAHGLGVIHRDVKPGNLLIDPNGDLWVTDFGLARFLEDPGPTRTGDLLGTLAYMSPEQALGRREVDHRTDVYSLGATLYELLTIRPAFEGRDRQELLRKIAHDEPIRPRRLNPTVPLDLETVVLKAMDKEPAGRYASAAELANDLGRFLDDKPIQARRPNLLELSAKWSRRHRPVFVTAVSLLLLTLTIGTILSFLLWKEQRRTLQVLGSLRESELETFKIVDSYTMKAMGRYTIDSMNKETRFDPTEASEFYEAALSFYDRVARKTDTDPATRDMVARANQRSGFTRMMTGRPGGEEAFRRAVSQYEKLVADEPAVRGHRDELQYALDDWAAMSWQVGRVPAAEPIQRRASEFAKQTLLAFEPIPSSLARFAANEIVWARKLEAAERAKDAEQVRNDLADFYRQLSSRFPAADPRRAALAKAHAGVAAWNGSYDRSTLERLHRLAFVLDPAEPTVNNNLAWLLCARPDLKPHDPAEAVALADKAVAGDPQNGLFWNTLGVARFRLGENEPARQALERSMALRIGGDPNDWFFLAMLSVHDGDREKAREWYEKSTAELTKKPTGDPDLLHFQSEAAAQLGIEPSPDGRNADKTKHVPRHEEDAALDHTLGAKGSPPPPRVAADAQD